MQARKVLLAVSKNTTAWAVHATSKHSNGTIAPQTAPTRGRRNPLGTLGKNISVASALYDAIALRYRRQSVAARLAPDEAVARCGRRLAPMAGVVGIVHSPSLGKAHYTGLERCHSVWHCSVCGAKITERRRDELHRGLKHCRDCGYRVVMCTYTIRHNRQMSLTDILLWLFNDKKGKPLGAWKRYKGGRASKQLRNDFGVLGTIRALEVTLSPLNGWHVHVHELVILPKTADVKAFGNRARVLWEKAAAKVGLSMNEHGFKLDDCDQNIADYVAKYGHEPRWQESHEMTKAHLKRSRKGFTPVVLLDMVLEAPEKVARWAAFKWCEYARAFKGHQQLVWSDGLQGALGIEWKTDTQLNEEEREVGERLAELYPDEWRVVLANDARAELLREADSGDIGKVARFLYDLGIDRFAPLRT